MAGLPPARPGTSESDGGDGSEGGGGPVGDELLEVNELSRYEAARWYWKRGLRPIPWEAVDGRKVVRGHGFTYREYLDAPTAMIDRLLERWASQPDWQVGLATATDGDWFLVDVDSYEELARWEAANGPLQGGTWVQDTGRADGGEHRLYRRGKTLGSWPAQGAFGPEFPHLEVKSNGFAAVSPSTHPSGRRYRWRAGCPEAPAEAGWQLATFLSERALRGSMGGPGGAMAAGAPIDVGAWLQDGLPTGEHDNALTRLALRLASQGYADLECLDVLRRVVAATSSVGPVGWSDENLLRKVRSGRELAVASRPSERQLEWARGAEGESAAATTVGSVDAVAAVPVVGGDEPVGLGGGLPPGSVAAGERVPALEGGPFPGPGTPLPVAQRLKWEWWDDGAKLPTRWHWRGGWLAWTGTHWAEEPSGLLQDWLYRRLEHETWHKPVKDGGTEPAPWNPNRRTTGEVERALEAVRRLDAEVEAGAVWDGEREEWGPDLGARVACRNGVVDLLTGDLRPHTPAWLNPSAVPFDYAPTATCPRWEAFLEEVFPGDPEARALLQEWFGYVLSGRTGLQKMLFLVGASRSGKSTTAGVLTRLVGAGNVAAPTLSSFGSNFGLSSLIGRPLAVIDDARYSRSVDMQVVIERLLSITGGGRLDVDRKNRAVWTGRLPTRVMMSSNELPWFQDASGAIVNRLLVLSYEQSFLGREDPTLERALEAELPGVLNWALAGLDRLARTGKFTVPASSGEVTAELSEQASPVKAFVEERCRLGVGERVEIEELFTAWAVWKGAGKTDRSAKTAFGIAMRAAYPQLRRKRVTVDHRGRPWFYEGVSLANRLPEWVVGG